jgi:DNA polymerase-3 subunit chi
MFYHLTRRPMEDTLRMLLEKARGAGWRVHVRGTSAERMTWLDEKLWLGPEEGFLAHGLAGEPHEDLQPVLLSTDAARPNGATCVMSVDGAEVAPEDVADLERVCVLFDGNVPEALDRARAQWREMKEAGVKAEYWSEENGPWERKAET